MRMYFIEDADGEKPVLAVSSGEYGQAVGFQLVAVCRKTSSAVAKGRYDVPISGEPGAVRCNVVLTVATDLLKAPRFATAVAAAEQAQVRVTLFKYLGLEP